MTDNKLTCAQCGKRFTKWRAKRYCSEPCSRKAQNGRVRGLSTYGATQQPTAQIYPIEAGPERQDGASVTPTEAVDRERPFLWTAANEVTRKLTREGSSDAIGWAILIDGHGWFGRIGKDFAFGPTTQPRAKAAVEARLRGEPFQKTDREKSWRGTCWRLLTAVAPPSTGIPNTPVETPSEDDTATNEMALQ